MCATDFPQPLAPSRDEEENRAYRHAITAYADDRFMALSRRAIHALTQFVATGIFESDNYNSVWDEYCHEVQHGPHSALDYGWDLLLDRILTHIIASLSRTEQLLLTLAANDTESDYQQNLAMWSAVCPDKIQQVVGRKLRGIAINRDLVKVRRRSR